MGLSDSSVLAILFLWDFSFSKSWENGELSVLDSFMFIFKFVSSLKFAMFFFTNWLIASNCRIGISQRCSNP